MPEVVEHRNRTSLGFKVGNQIGNMGLYGEKEKEEKIRLPRDKMATI